MQCICMHITEYMERVCMIKKEPLNLSIAIRSWKKEENGRYNLHAMQCSCMLCIHFNIKYDKRKNLRCEITQDNTAKQTAKQTNKRTNTSNHHTHTKTHIQ